MATFSDSENEEPFHGFPDETSSPVQASISSSERRSHPSGSDPSFSPVEGTISTSEFSSPSDWSVVLSPAPSLHSPCSVVPGSDQDEVCDRLSGTTITETFKVGIGTERACASAIPPSVPSTSMAHMDQDSTYYGTRQSKHNTGVIQAEGETRQRNKIYCFYCEESVNQFARHLYRNHSNELEVVRIKCQKKGSVGRRQLITTLRNKGNFLRYRVTNTPTPVRKPCLKTSSSDPLPCRYCYGFFAKKQLWRHANKCPGRNVSQQSGVEQSLNLAQNMTLSQVEGDDYLKNVVFPHMRADEITLVVKSDPLICAYGARYAKTHQDKHQVNLISRKMRELAKLLIVLKSREPNIKTLISALRPEYYKLIVEAAKEAAGYNERNNHYNSPTYAMNIQTSIKECCSIATQYLQVQTPFPDRASFEEATWPFERLASTVASEWKYDVSHQAANDLNSTSMNKVTIIPLASDLQRFRQYLVDLAIEATTALQYDENDAHSFRSLLESIYCRVMLLCRKRCGELSRLPLQLYLQSETRGSYEEFADTIRPSEMILVRKFKRVVMQGKRKATPVIFSDDVQQHLQIVNQLRPNFVSDSNPYLFANLNSENPIAGYKVLKYHSMKANLRHPEAITTRTLRKHLATVCQVLSMCDEDIEQLASFMGHTGTIHRQNYRLPDDIFQTAKVSKLLLMMEAGKAAQYKGKTLDEIELDMEDDINQEGAELCISTEIEDMSDADDGWPQQLPQTPTKVAPFNPKGTSTPSRTAAKGGATSRTTPPEKSPLQSPDKTRHFQRAAWTTEEKSLALEFFARHITERKPPRQRECLMLMSAHPQIFKNRSWQKLKIFVVNHYNTARPANIEM